MNLSSSIRSVIGNMPTLVGHGSLGILGLSADDVYRAALSSLMRVVSVRSEYLRAECPSWFSGEILDYSSVESSPKLAALLVGGLEDLNREDVAVAIKQIGSIASAIIYLVRTTGAKISETRHWWETQFIAAGYRKHPAYYQLNSYDSLEYDGEYVVGVLELVPQVAQEKFSAEWLSSQRSLHMDMLRESGRRSDAHVIRYDFASNYVRPGDRILDAACGLGYGSYLLASRTKAQSVLGLDLDGEAINYAQVNFSSARLNYQQLDLSDLSSFADNSFDLITSFETLEHVPNPAELIRQFKRVLRPSGRLIVSVPHLWVDESGKDPNPYHLHVYDWPRITAELSQELLLEARFGQDAGGGFKRRDAQRRIWSVRINETEDSEFCLAVAMKDPTDGVGVKFVDTVYKKVDFPPNLLEFGRDYDNPWLARALVEYPYRVQDSNSLRVLAQEILDSARPLSADYGAALCVIGYRLLDGRVGRSQVVEIEDKVVQYLSVEAESAHAFRWQVSLSFMMAELWNAIGGRSIALKWYDRCSEFDVERFSPILATKTTRAARLAGLLRLHDGDSIGAASSFQRSLELFKKALWSKPDYFLGDPNNPLSCTHLDSLDLIDEGMSSLVALSELMRNGSDGTKLSLIYNGTIRSLAKREAHDLQELVRERMLDLSRVTKERSELFDVAEERLKEIQKLVLKSDSLYGDVQRIGKEREELYQIAEDRLAEIKRLVAEIDRLKALIMEQVR